MILCFAVVWRQGWLAACREARALLRCHEVLLWELGSFGRAAEIHHLLEQRARSRHSHGKRRIVHCPQGQKSSVRSLSTQLVLCSQALCLPCR